jgi:hypothetical protein
MWNNEDYVTYLYHYYGYTQYIELQGNAACVAQTLNSEYYLAESEFAGLSSDDDDDSFGGFIALSALLILLH